MQDLAFASSCLSECVILPVSICVMLYRMSKSVMCDASEGECIAMFWQYVVIDI